MVTLPLGAPLTRLRRRFEHAPWAALAETAARLGYLARGAVYLSIGAIALLAALELTPRAQGAIGALEAWGDWPAGVLLLWAVGLGLYGFAGWRALQSVFDVDRVGTKPKALAMRAGQAISGLLYGSLAIAVFGLVDAMEDLHEADDQAATRAAVETALGLPFGEAIILAAGLFVIGAGVGSMARAFVDHFGRGLQCAAETRAWAGTVARIGYFGRGVALLPAGVLLAGAGLHSRAAEARGLEGALAMLERQPFGSPALALVALGLLAFGAFAVAEAWLRPMHLASLTAK